MAWLDGRPAAGLAVDDRGLAYGDGLFETIKISQGQPHLLSRHMARLGEGCRRLAIPCDEALLTTEIRAFAKALGAGVCKLILTRGSGLRGYRFPEPCRPSRLLIGAALPQYPEAHAAQGVALFPCVTRLAEQPLLAGLKHLNRLEQVLARAEWDDSRFAEGLMRDYSGRVIEGVFSNLLLVRKQRLVTPDLSRCGVAGVMRAEILFLAERAGLACVVTDVDLDDLYQAEEVFLCNSLYGIWPVVALEAHRWSVGPLTRKLQGLLANQTGIP
ncbi:aminodeoxychorismate lyase [Stutzerimonas tarimensis]|uniref:Aminodeoxychorismate lyase n=1 Tax=Stutzerimonas tarimensis TaxID=1507735 RepID=A0ABV7T9L3_9GAMM